MRKVVEICAKDFYEAVCEACFQANVNLPNEVYSSLEEISQVENQSKMQKIFANAFIAQRHCGKNVLIIYKIKMAWQKLDRIRKNFFISHKRRANHPKKWQKH